VALKTALGNGPVALDTSVFIYFIERDPAWLPLVRSLFAGAASGKLELVTSSVTLLEVLVVPYRKGDVAVAEQYESLLTRSRGLTLVAIDRPVLRAAAQLRAMHRLTTPDALQIAAALSSRCTAFVTNDRKLPSIGSLRVVQLSEMA
jgi:predicted nucleic acid-binding protein